MFTEHVETYKVAINSVPNDPLDVLILVAIIMIMITSAEPHNLE